MNDYLKYAAGGALFALWAGLVVGLKLDPADIIGTIKIALLAIMGYAGVTKLQASPAATPPAISPWKASDAAPTVPLQ